MKVHLSCVCVWEAVWLSYFCKLQWAAGLAAPVSPRGLKRECCYLLCYPNAKRFFCQTAPSCHCVTQSCSRSSSSLLVYHCPFRYLSPCFSVTSLCLSLFIVVLTSCLHLLIFSYLYQSVCTSALKFFSVLVFQFISVLQSFFSSFFFSYLSHPTMKKQSLP